MLHKCYTLHTNNREDFYDDAADKSQREANLLKAEGYITDAELAQQKVDNVDNGSKSNYNIYLEKYNDENDGFNRDKTTYTINFNFKENSTTFEKQRYLLIFLQIYINTLKNIGKFENFGEFNELFDLTNDKMNSFLADKTKIFEESEYVIKFKKSLEEEAEKIENIFKIIKMETERLFNETNYPDFIDDKVVIKLTNTMRKFNTITDPKSKEAIFYYIMNLVFIPSSKTKFIKIDPDDTKKDVNMLEYYLDEEKLLNDIKKAETGGWFTGPYNRYLQIDISGEELTITKYNTLKLKQELLFIRNPLRHAEEKKNGNLFMIGSKIYHDLYFVKTRFNSVDTSVSSIITPILENYEAEKKKPVGDINKDMINRTTGQIKPLSELLSERMLDLFKEQAERLTTQYNTPLFNLINASKLEGDKLCVISLLTKNDDFKYPRKCSDGLAEPGSNGAAGSTVSVVDSAASAGANGTGGGANGTGGGGANGTGGGGANGTGGGANGTGGGANGTGGGANGTGGGGANGTGGGANGTGGGANGTGGGANGTGTTLSPEQVKMKALIENQLSPMLEQIKEIKDSQVAIKDAKEAQNILNLAAKEEEEE